MRLAAAFLGIALACWGSAAGCLILVVISPDDVIQFYAAWGAALTGGLALGTTVASWVAYQDALGEERFWSA